MKIDDIYRVSSIVLELIKSWQPLMLPVYDHQEIAGNPGDVVKHVALIAAANLLMQSGNGTFYYGDTYAGYAYNPLKSSGEWHKGIGKIHDGNYAFSNHDICFWRDLWDCKYGLEGSVYPGSLVFIRKLCLNNGIKYRPRLWDISPPVISQLKTAYGTEEAEIYHRPATLKDFKGCNTDLLLIDPPDFGDVDKALSFFALVENVILWLPVSTDNGIETGASSEAYRKCRNDGVSIITVMWGGNKSTKGCRLVCQLAQPALLVVEHALLELLGAIEGWQMDKGK